MADDTSHVSRTAEELRRQVAAKIQEAREQLALLNGLEIAFGLTPTQFGELNGMTAPATMGPPTTGQGGGQGIPRRSNPQAIRADDFLGEEPMQAAKKFMAMVGHAITFDEIADAIQRGGAAVQGAGWREKLETSLMRSPYEVIKVADKTYGLASFYSEEQLDRLRGQRRMKRLGAPKPKRKKKAAPKAAAAPKSVERKADKPPGGKSKADDTKHAPVAESTGAADEPPQVH
jgi:hypothetical protein